MFKAFMVAGLKFCDSNSGKIVPQSNTIKQMQNARNKVVNAKIN